MELPQQAWLFRGQSFLDKEEIYAYLEAECQRLIDSCNYLKDFTLPGWHRAYLEDKAILKQEPNKLNKFLRTKTTYYRAMNQYKREKSLLKELRAVSKQMKADDNLKSKKYYPLRVKESLYMRKAEWQNRDKEQKAKINV